MSFPLVINFNMLKKTFLLAALCLTTCSVFATNGIFLNLQTGFSNQSGFPTTSEVNATSVENNDDPAFRVSIGYNHDIYSFLGLGLDVGYGRYGDITYHFAEGGTTQFTTHTLEFLALITAHIKNFDLTGEGGGVREEISATGQDAPANGHRNNMTYGIIGAYNFTPRFAATFTYAHVDAGQSKKLYDIPTFSLSINEYLFGIRYTFAS